MNAGSTSASAHSVATAARASPAASALKEILNARRAPNVMNDYFCVVHCCEHRRREHQGDEYDESTCKFSAPGQRQDHDCKHRDGDCSARSDNIHC